MVFRSFVAVILVLCLKGAWADDQPVILVWGDSLSAAYGIALDSGWVALLQQRLDEQGYRYRVVNGSVSGETTAGGLARLPAALERSRPAVLVLELGANDGLRGLPLKRMRANLSQMIELGQEAGARPLLLEMRIPVNYGAAYADAFAGSFGQVGAATGVPVVPFFLAAFALDEDQFQADGIHPREPAQPLMLDAVWGMLEPLLRSPPGGTNRGAAAAESGRTSAVP